LVANPRFAIYFVPAATSALYRFGAAVLGHDCYTGEAVAHPRAGELTEADWAALTAEPRRYGFHATLKAPFRLRSEFAEDDLVAELRHLAASITHYPRFEPAVDLIAGFVAIVPQTRAAAIDRLAADCLTRFDRFRAPLTADDKARRMAAGLNAAQAAHLEHWGYPYVLDEFRFHMTLTGHLAVDRRAATHALLRQAFAQACGMHPIVLDRLTLVRQDHPDAPFRVFAQVKAAATHVQDAARP
jgi:putative phosphonate metabolism protein